MKIIEKGHIYEFDTLDKKYSTEPNESLRFVNREHGSEHSGTQTQEVIRALIDRTRHCDNCLRWDGNDLIIHHLRMALVLHEARALLRKTEKGIIEPESIVTGSDGHFSLSEHGFRYGPFRERIVDDKEAERWKSQADGVSKSE